MAVLTIGSTNPNLSYILLKNPATQKESNAPFKRKIRKGTGYGWFSAEDGSQFRVWFKDAAGESSYATGSKAQFEYLDITRYNSPFLIINVLDEFFQVSYTKESEYDVTDKGYVHTLDCECAINNRSMANRFFRLSNGELGVREHTDGSLQFYSTTSVNHLLNFALVFALIQAAGDDAFIDLRYETLIKYVRALNSMMAPLWIRQAFVKAAVRSPERLNAIASELMPTGDFIIRYGNTQYQRYQFIKDQIKDLNNVTLFDIGCGELSHSFRLIKSYGDKIDYIYAFDKDPEIVENMKAKVLARQMDSKISVDNESSGFGNIVSEGSVVLLVELLEHMPLQEAKDLLQDVLSANPSKVIITTPDRTFNVCYGMLEGEMRHPDHHYELTKCEFHEHFGSCVSEEYETRYHYGYMDEMLGTTSNICVTISKKDIK